MRCTRLLVWTLAAISAAIACLAIVSPWRQLKWNINIAGQRLIVANMPHHVWIVIVGDNGLPGLAMATMDVEESEAIPTRARYLEPRAGLFSGQRFVAIPHWLILLATAPPPMWWMARRRKSSNRRRLGLCINCGYDLRASTDRCPECGLAFDRGADASAIHPVTKHPA